MPAVWSTCSDVTACGVEAEQETHSLLRSEQSSRTQTFFFSPPTHTTFQSFPAGSQGRRKFRLRCESAAAEPPRVAGESYESCSPAARVRPVPRARLVMSHRPTSFETALCLAGSKLPGRPPGLAP